MSAGYGRDWSCATYLDTAKVSTGVTLLIEALFRRLITPRGDLDDGDESHVYGADLLSLVGRTATEDLKASVPGIIVAELLKDDRVSECECSVAVEYQTDGMQIWDITIDVTPFDEADDFQFTIKVSGSEALLEVLT